MDKEQRLKVGASHYRAKRYAQACNAYTRAIQLDPNDFRAYRGKGLVLFCMHRFADALAVYDQAIQVIQFYPTNERVHILKNGLSIRLPNLMNIKINRAYGTSLSAMKDQKLKQTPISLIIALVNMHHGRTQFPEPAQRGPVHSSGRACLDHPPISTILS